MFIHSGVNLKPTAILKNPSGYGVINARRHSELTQNAAKHGTITITNWLLKIRGGFYADSAMYKHSAIANTTARGPVRSQDTKGGVLFSVLLGTLHLKRQLDRYS